MDKLNTLLKNKNILCIVLLILFCCLHHLPFFIISDFSGLGDPTNQDLPLRYLASKLWIKGEIPLINPYNFYGDSIAGKTHSGAFYPLNIIYGFFHPILAKKISTYFHYLILSLGMYLFLKSLNISSKASLFSSLLFSTNPIGFHYVIPCLNTFSWLPWIFLSINKLFINNFKTTHIILFALSLSLSFLGGYTQIWLYIILISSIYFLVRIIMERKFSFNLIKLILIAIIIFISICGIQLIISYSEFKFSVRSVSNICREFEQNKPQSWNFIDNIYDFISVKKVKDNIFYVMYGFFFPLYFIGILILFITKEGKISKFVICFIIIALLVSILFIGQNPCRFPFLKYFRHHKQFFPTLIPFVISLMAAYVFENKLKINLKLLLIFSLLAIAPISILAALKNLILPFSIEILFNIFILIILFIYKAKRIEILFYLFFIFAISYNSFKSFYVDKSYYDYNWFTKAEENNQLLINKKVIEKNALVYSDAFIFHSPYKRFLNSIFGIKNLQLNTFDALLAIDANSFFNRLSNNKIDVRNFKIFGVKYIIFNVESASEIIDKYYSSKVPELKELNIKRILSFCPSSDNLYYSYIDENDKTFLVEIKEGRRKIEEYQKPIIISCLTNRIGGVPKYLITIDGKRLVIIHRERRSYSSLGIDPPVFDFNIKAIQDNDDIIIFFIDIRARINLIRIRLREGNIKIIQRKTIADGYYKILPATNNRINERDIALLNRNGQIFLYNIDYGRLMYFDKLPGYVMSSFVLSNLAPLDLLKEEIKSSMEWKKIFVDESKRFEIWKYQGKIFPDLWFVSETKYISEEDFYNKLAGGVIDLDKVAYLDKKIEYKFKRLEYKDINIEEWKEQSIKLEINISDEAMLVIRNRWNICWSADLDEAETNIYRVNEFMQGIKIPAGKHKLKLNCNLRNMIIGHRQ